MRDAWSATATSSVIVPARVKRDFVVIQLHSGDPIAISIGVPAVFSKGLKLINAGDHITLRGINITNAIYAICDAGNSATGGYQH